MKKKAKKLTSNNGVSIKRAKRIKERYKAKTSIEKMALEYGLDAEIIEEIVNGK